MSAPAAKKAKVGHRLQYSRACCTQCTFLHPELRTFHVTLSHTPLFSNTTTQTTRLTITILSLMCTVATLVQIDGTAAAATSAPKQGMTGADLRVRQISRHALNLHLLQHPLLSLLFSRKSQCRDQARAHTALLRGLPL